MSRRRRRGVVTTSATTGSPDWGNYDGSQDGDETNLFTGGDVTAHTAVAVSNTKVLICYREGTTIKYKFVTRSGTTMSESGSVATSAYTNTAFPRASAYLGSDRALCAFRDIDTDDAVIQLIDTSGASPSIVDTEVHSARNYGAVTCEMGVLDTNKVVFVASETTSNDGYAFIVSVAADVITIDSTTNILTGGSSGETDLTVTDTDKFIWRASLVSLCSVSGSTVTVEDTETLANIDTSSTVTPNIPWEFVAMSATKCMVIYRGRHAGSGPRPIYAKILDLTSDLIDATQAATEVTTTQPLSSSGQFAAKVDSNYVYFVWEESASSIESFVLHWNDATDAITEETASNVVVTTDNLDHLVLVKMDDNFLVVTAQNESTAPVKQLFTKVIKSEVVV